MSLNGGKRNGFGKECTASEYGIVKLDFTLITNLDELDELLKGKFINNK